MCGDGAGDGDSGGMGMGSDGTPGGGSASDNDGVEGASASAGMNDGTDAAASAGGQGSGNEGGGFGVDMSATSVNNPEIGPTHGLAVDAQEAADMSGVSGLMAQVNPTTMGFINPNVSIAAHQQALEDSSAISAAVNAAPNVNTALSSFGMGLNAPVGAMVGMMNAIADENGISVADVTGLNNASANAIGLAEGVDPSDVGLGGAQSDGGADDIPNAGAYIKEKLGLASNSSSGKGGNQNRDLARGQFGHPGLRDGTSPRNDLPDFTHPYIERTS